MIYNGFAVVVQSLSYVRLFATPWTVAHLISLSFTISLSLLKFMSIELIMPSNHLILCHPHLLPSIFSSIRIFSNEEALHVRWPKYWSFSFSSFNEYSRLIYFRIDWFDLLAAQRICISNMSLDNTEATGLGARLWEALTWRNLLWDLSSVNRSWIPCPCFQAYLDLS